MVRAVMGSALRKQLTDDAATELVEFVEANGETWKTDMTERSEFRLRALASREDLVRGLSDVRQELGGVRLEMAGLRLECTQGFAQVRQEMASQRVELLRWSFLFWIGQVAATAGLISLSLHFAR